MLNETSPLTAPAPDGTDWLEQTLRDVAAAEKPESDSAPRSMHTSAIHAEAILKGEIREIPLDQLRESPWNPRQYYPEAAMKELVESMKQSGFRPWLPLMVRPLDNGDFGEFEIGAGHRRSRAAREAGLISVPCIVREMTDEEFLDVLNFDNAGREDVHPLHEAAGWQAWMEKTGKGVADIAARIGQSKEYVYQRLKYASLIDSAREAFLDGKLTDGHAILIARLQPNDQKKALKFCEPPAWDSARRGPSVRDLAAFIQRGVHLDLSAATFDLSDVTLLAGAGACDSCPKRTKNAPELILISEHGAIDAVDECTDPGCFNMKLVNHIARVKTATREETGRDPIEVSSNWSKAKKGVLSRNDYQLTEADKKGAKLAVIVDGAEAGKVIHVRLNPAPSTSSAASPASKVDPVQQEKDRAEREARIECERSIRRAILDAIRKKIAPGRNLAKWEIGDLIALALEGVDTRSGVLELCRVRGISVEVSGEWDDAPILALEKALPSLSAEEMLRLAIELPVAYDFDRSAIARNDPPKKLMDLARSYGIDAVKIRREAEASAKSGPGTRREVEKKGAAAPAAKKQPVAKKAAARKAPAKAPVKKAAPKASAKKTLPGKAKK